MKLKVIKKTEMMGFNLKIYGDYEKPLFNANEIARIIKNSNVSQMIKPIESEEKELVTMYGENNIPYKQWYLTEDGLYEILMLSRKPEAKMFKKRIKEILKSVRKYGGYIYVKASDNETEIQNRVTKLMEIYQEQFSILENEVRGYKDFLEKSRDTVSTSFLAEFYGMRPEDFLERLKELKIAYRKGKSLILYREHKYKGYAKYYRKRNKYVLGWTLKGEKFIDEKIRNSKIETEMIE